MPAGIRAFLVLAAALASAAALYSCGSSRHVTQPGGAAGVAGLTRQFSPSWQKGVSFPTWSHDAYDTVAHPETAESLRQLKALNATWVAIIPTWYMDSKSSNDIYPETTGGTTGDSSVEHIIDYAHELGLQVMLKPHVDPRDGTWRGSITPRKPNDWFASYQAFILHYADLAARKGVEQFSVGTELKTMSGPTYTANWRSIVAAVRGVFSAAGRQPKLTYAANWGHVPDAEYLRLEWWDALDYLGIDAFFPLSTVLHDTANTDPAYYAGYVDQVKAGWFTYVRPGGGTNHWMDELKGMSDRFGRPILFTEIGYNSRPNAADPWYTSGTNTPDQEAQKACVEAALQVWDQRSWIAGVFWWNWNTNPSRGGPNDTGMDLNNKAAVATITDWFGRLFTTDETPPTTPTGLATQALSNSEIRLTWNAAIDNVEVTGYTVYRDGTHVTTTEETAFTDGSLAETRTYQYQVSAVDLAGNESPLSLAVAGTTMGPPDEEPPTVPTNLRVTSATSTQIALAWDASTDNVGVTGYNAYRDGTTVNTAASTTYTDSGLSPATTYSYQVEAYDAAGKVSGPCPAVVGTTAEAPPREYTFEDGTTQGWTHEVTATGVSSANIGYLSARSLAVSLSGTSNKLPGGAGVSPLSSLVPGSAVTMRLYLVGNSTRVTARAYVRDFAGRTTYGSRISLRTGSWVLASVTVPGTAQAPIARLGVQVTTKNGTYTGDVYVDDVRW